MTSLFDSPDVDVDPRDYLPTVPGLAELLGTAGWTDRSSEAQVGLRTLAWDGGTPGVVVLAFRDELVDIVALRPGKLEQAVTPAPDVVGWLTRWADAA